MKVYSSLDQNDQVLQYHKPQILQQTLIHYHVLIIKPQYEIKSGVTDLDQNQPHKAKTGTEGLTN